jgi:collagenase-like PrtC family protease
LGEVVCSKRLPFITPNLSEVTERLIAGGKDVVYSTLALIMNQHERAMVADLAGAAEQLIEANDISAVSLLGGKPHVIGPYINTYNEGTAAYFIERGAVRIVLPAELPLDSLSALVDSGAELEMQVFGRLPLAISARCYHARSQNLHKDNCQYVCGEDADGMEVETLDSEKFLAVNGTQTLSHSYYNLAAELDLLAEHGITHFRLSPQNIDMVAAAKCFRDRLQGAIDTDQALDQLQTYSHGVPFANGFLKGQPGLQWTPAQIGAE